MKTRKKINIDHIDIHAAIARAHADRAAYVRLAAAGFPHLLKRLAGKLRPHRQHLPHSGAWA
jgi:hypothetical protein